MACLYELAIGAATFLLLYYYLIRNFNYWTNRHVAGPRPIPLFGSLKEIILGKIHLSDYIKNLYDAYPDEPAVGIFEFTRPTLVPRDPDMIKDVLIRDFATFADRTLKVHKEIEPMANNLVFLKPKEWRPLRHKLTPVFTSGKLKDMFRLVDECAEHFHQYMEKQVGNGKVVECREFTAKYTTDVIGVCAFGLNTNSISDEDSEFRRMGRDFFEDSLANKLRSITRFLPLWAALLLKPIVQDKNRTNFFIDMLTNTMEYRRKNNVRRNDFVDLLMDIRDKKEKIGDEEMSDEFMTAQAFVFFAAGFETSSNTMSNALYELAVNPHIQDELREEINTSYDENKGHMTYDAIKNMKYLDKVFKETLRKYPPLSVLPRTTLADHTFSSTKISINKGTAVLIPVYGLHYDPNVYPEPEVFDPERFTEESIKSRDSMYYLPFGDGPRNCIGERFAYMQSKLGLVTLLKHFKFETCDKTCIPYKKIPSSPFIVPEGGIQLKMNKV